MELAQNVKYIKHKCLLCELFLKKNHYICVSLSLRNEAGGLALSPCQKQHQEVWMGEKGKDNEAALNMN